MQIDLSSFVHLDVETSLGSSPSGAAFATSSGDILEASCYGPGIFRLRVGPNTRPDYGLVTGRAQRCEVARASPTSWSFTAGPTRLELTANPLQIRFFHADQLALSSITDRDARGRFRLPVIGRTRQGQHWMASFALLSGEPVYGLGARTEALNKRGQLIATMASDLDGSQDMQRGVPLCWSPGAPLAGHSTAWAAFAHTPGAVVHGVGFAPWSQRSYGVVVEDEALDLFLFAARDPQQLLERYTHLTARTPEPPPWSFGVWLVQNDVGADKAAETVAGLREHALPCDVLALDETALWDAGTQFDLQSNSARYPDPAEAVNAIKRHGLRICATESPYVSIDSPLFARLADRGFLLANAAGEVCIVSSESADPFASADERAAMQSASGLVDFSDGDAFAWWRDAHTRLFTAGIDAIALRPCGPLPEDAVAANGDRGRRLQNAHELLYRQCVYDAAKKFGTARNGAPVIMGRAGGAASQRWPVAAPPPAQLDWEGLAASIRAALSSAMSGTAYNAVDVAAPSVTGEHGAELYLRSLQSAVFSSHLRLSGAQAAAPWRLGKGCADIARHWLDFRYRLLPYLQSAAAQSARSGLPVMRAMALAFPGNALTRSYETQFMCGDALLVAPIIAQGGEVEIALPPGGWYDLASRQRVAGRQIVRYRASLDRFPVFGREGFALPLGRSVSRSDEISAQRPLETLWLFGKPAHSLLDFSQVRVAVDNGSSTVATDPSVKVEAFGDIPGLHVDALA